MERRDRYLHLELPKYLLRAIDKDAEERHLVSRRWQEGVQAGGAGAAGLVCGAGRHRRLSPLRYSRSASVSHTARVRLSTRASARHGCCYCLR